MIWPVLRSIHRVKLSTISIDKSVTDEVSLVFKWLKAKLPVQLQIIIYILLFFNTNNQET